MSPKDGFKQFLPVASASEQEHQAECPDEVGAKEKQAIAAQ
jgi:hypothetical protein